MMADDRETRGGGEAGRRRPAGSAADMARHLDLGTLTAHLDRELSDPDQREADRHLRQCADCRQELNELRATVTLLNGLPQYAPRRSFRVGSAHAVRPSGGGWLARLLPALPALRAATAAAAILLLLVVAGDLFTSIGDERTISEPVSAPQQDFDAGAPANQVADDGGEAELEEAAPGGNGTNSIAESSETAAAPNAARQPAPANAATSGIATPPTSGEATDDLGGAGTAVAESTDGPSLWRIAQLALGLLLLWLIVTVVGLERLRR